MTHTPISRILPCRITAALCLGALCGCTTLIVPPGAAGTVRVIQGGLVETIAVEDSRPFNIQVTHKEVPPGKAQFEHLLTIGTFSRVIGSGFSRRSNIYYQKPIGGISSDTFSADGKEYRVSWRYAGLVVWPEELRPVFDITIEPLTNTE